MSLAFAIGACIEMLTEPYNVPDSSRLEVVSAQEAPLK